MLFKELDTVGRKGGKSPVTYFDEAASHSSQMPLLLNLVDKKRKERKQSSVFHSSTLERGMSSYNTTLRSAGTADREDTSQLKILTKAQLVF